MKGAMDGMNFLKKCKSICIKNNLIDKAEREKFSSEWGSVNQDKEYIGRLSKAIKSSKRQQTINIKNKLYGSNENSILKDLSNS